jgi:chromosome partitioning protein
MLTVSVINYKGGVGKTTVTANLAAELAWRGKNVLLIDLDPQASLTFSFLTVDDWERNYAENRTIRNWYYAYIDEDQNLELSSLIVNLRRITQMTDGSLDIICSHLNLINIDLELATKLGGASPRQSRNNFLRLHSRLLDGLESADVQEKYDFVIIDCPPNFNIVTKTAIVASDRVLVPAIPDRLSTLGVEELQRHINELVKDFNEYAGQDISPDHSKIAPSIMGIIPTMVQIYAGGPISTQASFLTRVRGAGLPVFDTYIRRNNSKYGNAPQYGVPVVLQSASGGTYLAVRGELEALATEFLRRV